MDDELASFRPFAEFDLNFRVAPGFERFDHSLGEAGEFREFMF